MESKCRQNYNQESEALVNHQINIRLNIRHYFQSQSAFYGRDDVGLKGFEKYFACLANQEHKQAEKLVQYQNDRGGRAVFGKIDSPNEQEWSTPLVAIELALSFKKKANLSLLELVKVADGHHDAHLSDFLKNHLLKKQVETINKLAIHHTNLLRVGNDLGVFLYDKELL